MTQSNIRSRNRHVWATSKGQSRAATINIVCVARGPTRVIRGMVDSEIEIKKQNYEQITSTHNDTSKEEVKALIGILVLTAALKDNHLTLDELFNTEYSGTRYVSCMRKKRFDFLLRCLQFDDRTFRFKRHRDDPFIPIRDIWEMLITQCRKNYEPGTNVTTDDQLLAFRGRCKFRM